MVAPAALPLSKLVGLFIKTLSKPMAKQLKHQFVKRPITRSVLIWVGQASNSMTTRMTIWSSGYKVRSINQLEEEAALSRGADLLSETFIFAVSGGIVVYEYNRSSEKEKKKEEARLQKIRDDATRLQAKLNSLDKRLVALEEFAKANRQSILGIVGIGANGGYREPEEVVPINDDGGEESPAIPSDNEKPVNQNEPSTVKSSSTRSQRSWKLFWPF